MDNGHELPSVAVLEPLAANPVSSGERTSVLRCGTADRCPTVTGSFARFVASAWAEVVCGIVISVLRAYVSM